MVRRFPLRSCCFLASQLGSTAFIRPAGLPSFSAKCACCSSDTRSKVSDVWDGVKERKKMMFWLAWSRPGSSHTSHTVFRSICLELRDKRKERQANGGVL